MSGYKKNKINIDNLPFVYGRGSDDFESIMDRLRDNSDDILHSRTTNFFTAKVLSGLTSPHGEEASKKLPPMNITRAIDLGDGIRRYRVKIRFKAGGYLDDRVHFTNMLPNPNEEGISILEAEWRISQHPWAYTDYPGSDVPPYNSEVIVYQQGDMFFITTLIGGKATRKWDGDVGTPKAYGKPLKDTKFDDPLGVKGKDTKIEKDYNSMKDRNTYDDLIVKWSAKYNIDPNLVKAIMWKESTFKLKAQSSVGASGLTQVMPGTARGINKVLKYDRINLGNADQAVHFGVFYIVKKMNQVSSESYRGSTIFEYYKDVANVNTGGTGYSVMELGLMAYNAGKGNLRKYGPKTVMSDTWDCKNGLCGQTKHYVKKITRWYEWLLENEPL